MRFRYERIGRLWLGWAIWLLLPTPGRWHKAGAAVEAIAGEPLGVGRVTIDLPPQELPAPLGPDGLGLTEKDGRVLYPAMRSPMFGGLLREMLGPRSPLTTGGPVREQVGGLIRGFMAAQPPRVTIYFLFRGDEPLSMTLEARKSYPLQAVPRHDPAMHRLLLGAWWRDYALRRRSKESPIIRRWWRTTLPAPWRGGSTCGCRATSRPNRATPNWNARLGVMLETESILMALEQDRILGMTNFALPADQPLPEPVDPPPLEVPEPDAKVEDRADRHARAGRVVLRPLRQLQQFPLDAGHAGHLGRRPAEPRRPARPGLRPRASACRTS